MTLDKPIYYPEVVFSNSNIPNFMSSIFKQDRYNVTSHYDPDLYGWEPRFYSYRDMKLGRIPKQYVWPKDMSKFKKVHVKKEKEFPKIAALNGLPSPERYKPDNKRSFDNYMPAFSIAGATPCTEPTTPPPLIPPGVSIEDSAGHWHIFTISGDGAVKTYLGLDGTCPRWNPAVTEIFYNHNTVVTPAGAFLRNLVVSAPQHHSRISLDGLKVLYLCNGNIWVTNYDGSGGNVQLTNSGADARPQWSPDGARIAFARSGNIWVMNSNGSGPTQITSGGSDDRPRGSPNSLWLTFWSNRDGNNEVYKIAADGTSETRLTNDAATDYRCRFIGTGTQIGFLTNRNGGGLYDFYIMDADGSNLQQITSGGITYWGIRWSEEAGKFFYEKATGGYDIYTCNFNGSGETNICNTAFQELDFKWSGRADFM